MEILFIPIRDLENLGYDEGSFFQLIIFIEKISYHQIYVNYYISEISSDRTEVRLKSNAIPNDSNILQVMNL